MRRSSRKWLTSSQRKMARVSRSSQSQETVLQSRVQGYNQAHHFRPPPNPLISRAYEEYKRCRETARHPPANRPHSNEKGVRALFEFPSRCRHTDENREGFFRLQRRERLLRHDQL